MDRLARILGHALLAVALGFCVLYLLTALARISYPFELEWMEGEAVEHVARLVAGKTIYPEPSLDFIPFTYTPFYFQLTAFVSSFTGVGFVPLRAVSLLASLGCLWLVFALVRAETRSAGAGVLAAGLFAATYRASGGWFDIARIDSMLLLLLLGAMFLVRNRPTLLGYAVAGGLMALAFLTKQVGATISLPLALYALLYHRRPAVALVVTAGLIVAGTTVYFNAVTDGWYDFYVFDSPRNRWLLHLSDAQVSWQRFVAFWTTDLLLPFAIALAVGAFYFLSAFERPRAGGDRSGPVFFLCAAAGLVGGALLGRIEVPNFLNTLLPAHLAIALLFGLGLHALHERIEADPGALRALVALLGVVQLAVLAYDPRELVPDDADEAAGRAFIETLKEVDGEVWLPSHGHYPSLAGKRAYAHTVGINDVLEGDDGEIASKLGREIDRAIAERKFAAIVLDKRQMRDRVSPAYEQVDLIFDEPKVFYPVTGFRTRPTFLFTARPE